MCLPVGAGRQLVRTAQDMGCLQGFRHSGNHQGLQSAQQEPSKGYEGEAAGHQTAVMWQVGRMYIREVCLVYMQAMRTQDLLPLIVVSHKGFHASS